MWNLSVFLYKVTSVFFPATCINCRTPNFSVCDSCLKQCRKAVDSPFLYCTSVYSFKDPLIKKIIHSIKYFHRADLVPPIANMLARNLQETKNNLFHEHDWILVPIPMSRLRKYMRGYNQAELLAHELGKQLHLPVDTTILVRTQSPKQQVKTESKKERLKNQHNSFKVVTDVSDRRIILIDDVTTTGATISEARRVLLNKNAKEVIAVTIAH